MNSEKINENFSEDIENFENSESKKESLTERFERERGEWQNKIEKMTIGMRDIYECSSVLTDALSERQIALEYTHTLMTLLSKINADLREKKKERFIFYSQNYDIRLDKDPKNMFIDVDLRKQVLLQEIFSNHLSYMRGTIDTIDKLIFGIKWRLQLEEYKRSQH